MSEEPLATASPSVKSYPIVYSAPMEAARRSGPFNLFGARRSAHEMVQVTEAHYALIYRVDGKLVRDDSQNPRSDVAVRATHVSVVDVRKNAPVLVKLSIPAQKSQTFTLVATFGCTVKDPLLVVRLGLSDPREILTNYLLEYHNIMQMGLDYRIDQINAVRRSIHDELTAYQTVHPAIIDGLEVQNASIDVMSPQRQVARDEADLNEQDAHMQRMAKLLNETQRELAEERRKSEKATREAAHRYQQAMADLEHDHGVKGRNVAQELWEQGTRQDAAIDSQKKLSQAKIEVWLEHQRQLGELGIDPADYIAVVDGGLSHAELAGQRREDRQAIAANQQHQVEEERRRQWAEDDHKRQVDLKRLEQEHELAREAAANDRTRVLIEAQLQNLTAGLNRDAADKQRQSIVTLISSLAERGQLDMMDLGLEGLIGQLGGADVAKALDAASTGAKPGSEKGSGPAHSADAAETAEPTGETGTDVGGGQDRDADQS